MISATIWCSQLISHIALARCRSLRELSALITTLPKPNKTKFYLKNWRPISLLGVDYKIASAVIAIRMKKVLSSIISHTQKGFLKNTQVHGRKKIG